MYNAFLYPYFLTERRYKTVMKNEINKKELKTYVTEGYINGLVKIIYAEALHDHGCDGIACTIGDNTFYFANIDNGDYDNVDDFLRDTSKEQNIDDITNAIIDIYKEIEDYDPDGEAMYYFNYLKHHLKKSA